MPVSINITGLLYPPTKELESMIQYMMSNKTIPAALPEQLRLPSLSSTYPTCLIPDQMFCQRSDPLLITSKINVLTNTRVTHGTPTALLREWFSVWSSHRETLSSSKPVLHTETLTRHEHQYSCLTCGDHHGCHLIHILTFCMLVSDIKPPPQDFNGNVNMEDFWKKLSLPVIGRGFYVSLLDMWVIDLSSSSGSPSCALAFVENLSLLEAEHFLRTCQTTPLSFSLK
ncbi:hypothetical protein G5714_004302 [Onychostoma macrolepis]|uniref:Uncharacterized protein n=1 Tax=Onychostoma macrolepis TaxID=369639 RepID=A0A7J6D4B1_9TELE|nr:hypothetical protein G5714_004302 [Onychostoma macrolepis]